MSLVLQHKLEELEQRIEAAARRSGRRRDQITLVAVTKTFPASAIIEAYDLGLRHFGENYVQEFEAKAPALAGLVEARFHFLGHLQSNKARRAAELFQVIETVDSEKLSRKLNEIGTQIEVMLEIKLGGEHAKSGVDPRALPALLETLRAHPNLRLTGLMTMPPWSEDAEESRPYFQCLRRLADEHGLPNVSMGMSQDFEVAIEEGATHVRIGTALFGSRRSP